MDIVLRKEMKPKVPILYMYIYVCMCMCVCVYIYIYACIYTHTHSRSAFRMINLVDCLSLLLIYQKKKNPLGETWVENHNNQLVNNNNQSTRNVCKFE